MSFGDACLYSLTGILVVFFALVLLMCIIKIMTAVGDSMEKKAALAAAGAAPVSAAPEAVPAESKAPEKTAPRYTRELKLWDTDPRDAAMIMAIVAETTQIPLKELQFLSIKEIKGDNQE